MSLVTLLCVEWLHLETDTVIGTNMPCHLYTLRFNYHTNISHLLVPPTEKNYNTTQSVLARIYSQHNFESQTEPVSPSRDAQTILPQIDWCQQYTVLAINATELEKFIQDQLQPDFSLFRLMDEFCVRYELNIERTFPSLRYAVCNRQQTTRRPLRPKPDDDIYDNEQLMAHLTRDRSIDDKAVKAEQKRRKLQKRRDKAVSHNLHFDRLLPVSLMPLIFDQLPGFYQKVNNTFGLFHQFRDQLLHYKYLHGYPTYVKEQIEMLCHNTDYLAFRYQQSHFQLVRQDKTALARHMEEYEKKMASLAQLHELEVNTMREWLETLQENIHVLLLKLNYNGSES